MLQLFIYTCFGTTTTLAMLFRVLGVWLLVHLIFNRLLDLDVTEININFEINIKKNRNKKIKKYIYIKNAKRCRDMACQEVCKQGRDDA